jgi:hypothetical protein
MAHGLYIGVKAVLTLSVLTVLVSCAKTEDPTVKSSSSRWMDRTVYFAKADAAVANRNNFFQKQKVQGALNELQNMTMLGENYFSYAEIDESSLNTALTKSDSLSEGVSFILIWPDNVFNDYVVNVVRGQIPDPNAITIINAANKRKFFIIIRASCVDSSSPSNTQCSNLGVDGLKALIARQLGLLVGLSAKDCSLFPTDIMCATTPSGSQYSSDSKLQFSSAFNNSLENILLNPSYYQ